MMTMMRRAVNEVAMSSRQVFLKYLSYALFSFITHVIEL